jgi:hypothetical protein
MNKNFYFLITTLLINTIVFANINALDLNKISYKNEIQEDLNFIIKNESLFNHWNQNWNYELSKEDGLKILKKAQEVSSKKAKNYEELLLTGILSHYLYNLEEDNHFVIAESFFKKAIRIKNDYRGYWFLGNHYAHSSKTKDAISNFRLAENLNKNIKIPEFWQEYAFAFYLAGMTSHSKKGLNNARLLGKPSNYENTILNVLKENLKEFNKNDEYQAQKIWDYRPNGELADFTSRALGLKFSIDSTWTFNISKFSNRTSVIVINPKSEKNINGKSIDYSIMLMVHIPLENESLAQYSDRFIKKYNDKVPNNLYDELNPNLSFEIFDPKMYSDIGGAHIQFMAIERDKPLYPGLELETPLNIPKNNDNNSTEIYRLKSGYDRFNGKIQYILILDTCEDIYEKSIKVYSDFLTKLIIE